MRRTGTMNKNRKMKRETTKKKNNTQLLGRPKSERFGEAKKYLPQLAHIVDHFTGTA
jgi:chromatin remodeling complex protein RSC6